MTDSKRPVVGVAVFVFNSKGEFVIGQRKGGHGAGTYGLPGGHLEYKESFTFCAEREIMEETNLQVRDVKFLTATNDFHEREARHGVTVFMTARKSDDDAVAELLEPEKCQGWRWMRLETILENHARLRKGEKGVETYFLPIYNMIEQAPDAVDALANWKPRKES